MQIEASLLSDKDIQKIKLYLYLSDQTGDLKSFSRDEHYTYATVYSYYVELMSDLTTLSGQQGSVTDLLAATHLDQYRHWLYQQSITYQFVLTSLLHPETTLADFLATHHLSQATLYRRTRPLLTQLKRYGIRFTTQGFHFIGLEQVIQNLYFRFLQATNTAIDDFLTAGEALACDELSDPFRHSSQLKHTLVLDKARRTIVAIWIVRGRQQHWFLAPAITPPLLHELTPMITRIEQRTGLSSRDARIQAQGLDYWLCLAPQTINYLSDQGRQFLQDRLGTTPNLVAAGQPQAVITVLAQQAYSQALNYQLLALGLYAAMFDLAPMMERELIATVTPDEATRQLVSAQLPQLEHYYHLKADPHLRRLWVEVLTPYIYLVRQHTSTTNFYVTADVASRSTDIVAHWFGGITQIRPLSDLPAEATPQTAVVVYGVLTPNIQALMDQERVSGFQWVTELDFPFNLDRLLHFLASHHLSVFTNRRPILQK